MDHGLVLPAYVRDWIASDPLPGDTAALGQLLLDATPARLRDFERPYEAGLLFRRLVSEIRKHRAEAAKGVDGAVVRFGDLATDPMPGAGDDGPLKDLRHAAQIARGDATRGEDHAQGAEPRVEFQGEFVQSDDLLVDPRKVVVGEGAVDRGPPLESGHTLAEPRHLGAQPFDLRHADSLLASSGTVAAWGAGVIIVLSFALGLAVRP